jgi:hypothetical protein
MLPRANTHKAPLCSDPPHHLGASLSDPSAERRDPAGEVDLHNTQQVGSYIHGVLDAFYPQHGALSHLSTAIADVAAAYRGDYPGLLRCDTLYHDLRHALDTAVATARLVSGLNQYRRAQGEPLIDAQQAVLTIILALFHDIGLLRRTDESHLFGAQLTPVHEERSVAFAKNYLSSTPLAAWSTYADIILLTKLSFALPKSWKEPWRTLACCIATADILSQSADRAYLEKCRDFLFLEFSAFGLAGFPGAPYPDRNTLLAKTPSFHSGLIRQRLDEEYGGVHRYLDLHFNGHNPYRRAIQDNLRHLEKMLATGDFSGMRREPTVFIGLNADA